MLGFDVCPCATRRRWVSKLSPTLPSATYIVVYITLNSLLWFQGRIIYLND